VDLGWWDEGWIKRMRDGGGSWWLEEQVDFIMDAWKELKGWERKDSRGGFGMEVASLESHVLFYG
jgi:hypothetical protein